MRRPTPYSLAQMSCSNAVKGVDCRESALAVDGDTESSDRDCTSDHRLCVVPKKRKCRRKENAWTPGPQPALFSNDVQLLESAEEPQGDDDLHSRQSRSAAGTQLRGAASDCNQVARTSYCKSRTSNICTIKH